MSDVTSSPTPPYNETPVPSTNLFNVASKEVLEAFGGAYLVTLAAAIEFGVTAFEAGRNNALAGSRFAFDLAAVKSPWDLAEGYADRIRQQIELSAEGTKELNELLVKVAVEWSRPITAGTARTLELVGLLRDSPGAAVD